MQLLQLLIRRGVNVDLTHNVRTFRCRATALTALHAELSSSISADLMPPFLDMFDFGHFEVSE